MKTIRILIVDDHPLMQRALRAAIETENDLSVIASAKSGIVAQKLVSDQKPDVVLMDLLMPGGSGIDAIEAIRASHPEIRILVVTSLEDHEHVMNAIKVGAHGYLTKAADTDELVKAIRVVNDGQSYMPPNIAAKLMSSVRDLSNDPQREPSPMDELTQRELEVFQLVGQGQSNAKIGKTLVISKSTVNVHIHNIMNKLGFEKRRELVAFAAQRLTL